MASDDRSSRSSQQIYKKHGKGIPLIGNWCSKFEIGYKNDENIRVSNTEWKMVFTLECRTIVIKIIRTYTSSTSSKNIRYI
jgi:outer membrane biogenesis lipoprotein LolB